MKRLLLLGVLLVVPAAHAQEPKIQCRGENTVEMRYCAGLSWEQPPAEQAVSDGGKEIKTCRS